MTDQSSQGPDARQLREQKLPRVPFPGRMAQALRIHVAPHAYEQMLDHAREDISVEVCGVLVGRLQMDDDGPYVSVTASIRGEAATNKFAEVTFTHETWARINQEMDQHHADEAIVGWYHTHPDFGVFLSDRDRFIHEHFFSGPGQLALVIDPVRRIEGFFIWQDGKPVLTAHYWVGDDLKIAPPSPSSDTQHTASDPHESDRIALTGPEAMRDEPAPFTSAIKVLMIIVLFVLGWMLGSSNRAEDRVLAYKGAFEKLESEGLLKFVTPQLQNETRKMDRALDLLAADLRYWQPKVTENEKAADDGKEPQISAEKQAQVRASSTLRDLRVRVRDLQQYVAVSAAESEAFRRVLIEALAQAEAQRKAQEQKRKQAQQEDDDAETKQPTGETGSRDTAPAQAEGDGTAEQKSNPPQQQEPQP